MNLKLLNDSKYMFKEKNKEKKVAKKIKNK